jgi:hypothetical protein
MLFFVPRSPQTGAYEEEACRVPLSRKIAREESHAPILAAKGTLAPKRTAHRQQSTASTAEEPEIS